MGLKTLNFWRFIETTTFLSLQFFCSKFHYIDINPRYSEDQMGLYHHLRGQPSSARPDGRQMAQVSMYLTGTLISIDSSWQVGKLLESFPILCLVKHASYITGRNNIHRKKLCKQ